jgi:hypothetical protein
VTHPLSLQDSTDDGVAEFNDDEWREAIEQFKGLKNRFSKSDLPQGFSGNDITDLSLNHYINDGAKVIVLVSTKLADNRQGFWVYDKDYPLTGSWTEDHTVQGVVNKQIEKMKNQRFVTSDASRRKDASFILNWTVSAGITMLASGISYPALNARDAMFWKAFNEMTPEVPEHSSHRLCWHQSASCFWSWKADRRRRTKHRYYRTRNCD